MLFIGIVIVFLVYAALYLVWDASNVSLRGPEGWLASLGEALLRPQNEVFFILRSLLALALVYVILDYFVAGARRTLKRRKREKNDSIQATFKETNDHAYRDS